MGWFSLQTQILTAYQLKKGDYYLKSLMYHDGEVTISNWENCRWSETDVFQALIVQRNWKQFTNYMLHPVLYSSSEFDCCEKICDICSTLSRYYASKNRKYDRLFSRHCYENGMDDDSLETILMKLINNPETILLKFD
eukprot:185309_1